MINWFSSIGLVLDVIGTILIFNYGILPKIHSPPNFAIGTGLDEKQKKENKITIFWSKTGLILVIFGFFFQFLSSIVCPSCTGKETKNEKHKTDYYKCCCRYHDH